MPVWLETVFDPKCCGAQRTTGPKRTAQSDCKPPGKLGSIHSKAGIMHIHQPALTHIAGTMEPDYETILTPDARQFLSALALNFDPLRRDLLEQRRVRQNEINAGIMPDFLPETAHIRQSEWKVAPIVPDLTDRRVEITGPVERKMMINALNSGANVFMADFEDANSPAWRNVMNGQINLRDAANSTIELMTPEGKWYSLNHEVATLMVRPRGWHLEEANFLVGGKPISASLFDFGLYFFHNADMLVARGTAPYFYLPKLESHLEARLWNEVFLYAQDYCCIPKGTIRATVLIETILAAFEMDEILWELRQHSAGLNCGRWDYIFSFIKKFRNHPQFVLPDRAEVTMERHCLSSYVKLLIETCHRRGTHAMGGMAAQIPIKNDPEANARAFEKVRQDKLREVLAGHDGTWVAHPGLVPLAKQIFDEHMPAPHQIIRRAQVSVDAADLLAVPDGPITETGLRRNIDIGIQYLESWLRGNGCVPIYNLMEDAATAEICRSQVWQWVRHGARLDTGARVNPGMVQRIAGEVVEQLRPTLPGRTLDEAARIFQTMMIRAEFTEFLTLAAYQQLTNSFKAAGMGAPVHSGLPMYETPPGQIAEKDSYLPHG
jgi:malate synthase